MNPVLEKLGYGPQDRVVIIHADDIGMCQATLPAITELFDFGIVSSAATMAPCPWFPEVARLCRAHPTLDFGVHLTVNAEWDAYRWGPISTRDPASGLLDEQGYFHNLELGVQQHADPQAVEIEMRAQVARAIASGIVPTHVDSHMGTVMLPPFYGGYLQVAREFNLPLFLVGGAEQKFLERGYAAAEAAHYAASGRELDALGMPVFDSFSFLPLHDPTDHVAVAKRLIDELPPGLGMIVMHPTVDTPEVRAMADDWRCRVANYEAMRSSELRDYIRNSGVQVIGYKPLRDLLRAQ